MIAFDNYRNVSKQDLAFAIHENGIAAVDLYNLKQLLQGLHQTYRKQISKGAEQ